MMDQTKNVSNNSISRRSLITGGALASAGALTIGALAKTAFADEEELIIKDNEGKLIPSFLEMPEPIDEADISETFEADVVVVGQGLAGVAATRSAAEAGLTVIAIERASTVSSRSSGFAAFNTESTRSLGIDDIDTAELVNECMTQMGHRPDARILKTWADNCGEAFDWYAGAQEGLVWVAPGESNPTDDDVVYVYHNYIYKPYVYGIDHEKIFSGSISFGPNGHAPILQSNFDVAMATGNVTDLFDTRALQLIKNGERVCGVIAQRIADGTYIKATASKGVILATGGYLSNDEMVQYYIPWIWNNRDKYAFSYMTVDMNAEKTNMGDGHRMGYWAGGHIEEGPHAAMAHGDLGSLGVDAFLQLNARGERYINEDLTNDHFGTAIVRQPEATIYQIFDADWPNQVAAMQGGLGTVSSVTEELIDTVDEWTTASGDTFEELAANLGMDEQVTETMIAQITRYNELCEAGKDEDFGKAAERMFALNTPPFYAIKYTVSSDADVTNRSSLRCLVSLSGLTTNTKAQVLDDNFNILPGLYAVGNVQGGRFLADYPATIAGMSHSIALTYGYLAGKNIAEEA